MDSIMPTHDTTESTPLLASKSTYRRATRKWLQSPSFVSNIILFVVVLVSFAGDVSSDLVT